jgi:hypothetical protein
MGRGSDAKDMRRHFFDLTFLEHFYDLHAKKLIDDDEIIVSILNLLCPYKWPRGPWG